MTGKQNAIFWIGLFMILINFWASGQSSILWKNLTTGGSSAQSTITLPARGKGNPGSPGSQVGGGIPHINVPPGP